MLLVPHYIADSRIHGLGVFAEHWIAKGTLIWEFNPLIDLRLSRDQLRTLPDHARTWVESRAEYYPVGDFFILGADGDQFMNHSDDPNLYSHGLRGFAIRDIARDEELTCCYRQCPVLGAGLSPPTLDARSG
jgi:SET domain-containing protein